MAGWCEDPRDVEYAEEDEAGQLGLGVPGEQRAIPTLATPAKCPACGWPVADCVCVERAKDPAPAEVRAMFEGLGWSVTG